ncbi:hypothetical protein VHEMI06921 [[Torrubiella] hemipterigena]|uniref:CHY-type domain-containing protein n=1 Tax=[Torrubiella] hemipterigena TaxID=1531966 RepID=A0A0A1T220_9HYPO|nr:hypothetical protein VHEMI06921 [[Torrubiella] hemipterigena]
MLPLHQATGSATTRKQATNEAHGSRIVSKPVPDAQARDPRGYQISQIRKRYVPTESTANDGAALLKFHLKPSDPDFPFELAYLDCEIKVPKSYPKGSPELRVLNKDIPRGFSINVERGWDALVTERKGATLLSLCNALDKNLEKFLSEQKVETIKIVTYKDTRHLDQAQPTRNTAISQSSAPAVQPPAPSAAPVSQPAKSYVPERTFTREEMNEAKARRAQEVRQLEARMSKLTLYRRSADGIVYTLPLEPKRKEDLPVGLRSVNNIHLIIPMLYPLQSLRVQLNEADAADAEPIEDMFVERAEAQKQMSLMSHVNYLAQNLLAMSKQAQSKAAAQAKLVALQKAQLQKESEANLEVSQPADDDKSHIKVIPRPPEWSFGEEDDESSEEYTDSDGGAAISDEEAPREVHDAVKDVPERGTMISFPSVELHGIELLQVSILNLNVKCERCKTVNELTGLKPNEEKSISCRKCGTIFAVTFHPQLVHEHSTRAGFMDLSGCKVADMLPSTFVPTCGRCSTAGMGLVAVRGDNISNVCRECHGKFTFKIPDVKFLFITPGTAPPPTTGPRRKQEKLGLVAGESLPNHGACAHYRKSYRWFRFSCCNKVYSCDRCHDETEDHPIEWANRMVCGWCSREQNYAVESCRFCGRGVIGRKGHGFWEGGKGTRDQQLMNRKDPRKYKRLGAAVKKA